MKIVLTDNELCAFNRHFDLIRSCQFDSVKLFKGDKSDRVCKYWSGYQDGMIHCLKMLGVYKQIERY